MPVPPFRRMRSGQPLSEAISASDENRLRSTVEALARVTSGSGDRVNSRAGAPVVYDDTPPWILVRIVSGSNPYSFTEARDDGAGVFYDLTEGIAGTAYELTGNTAVPSGTHTWARLADDRQGWLIFYPATGGGGGGGTGIGTREVDLTPSYTGVSTLTFDQADGFSLSQPVAGETRIDLLAATLTQAGIVSLVKQTMGAGEKDFTDKVGIGTTSALANSALDVRGYTYVYFGGVISFGGGNTPASESDGAILQRFAPDVILSNAAADYTAGRLGGLILQAANKRVAFRHKTAVGKKLAWYNDDTSTYEDGVTGTGGGGDTVTGGLITALGTLAGGTGITIGVVGNTVTITATLTSPLTTKGDIWCWSTTNTRRSVGTNGQVLTADSTDATGLAWTTLSIPTTANSRITTVDQTTTLLTPANITGLSFSVLSGEVWSFECWIRNNKSALTAGIKYAVNAPATSTLEIRLTGTTTGPTASTNERISALATLSTNAYNTAANIDGWVRLCGVVVAGANGTVQIQHASVTSGTATARVNSYITARKIS